MKKYPDISGQTSLPLDKTKKYKINKTKQKRSTSSHFV
jgi:hypothetical protein